MKELLRVEGHKHFYRDSNSKAIIIDDKEKLINYDNQKRTIEFNAQNMNAINNKVESLNKDFQELKNAMNIIIALLKNKGS